MKGLIYDETREYFYGIASNIKKTELTAGELAISMELPKSIIQEILICHIYEMSTEDAFGNKKLSDENLVNKELYKRIKSKTGSEDGLELYIKYLRALIYNHKMRGVNEVDYHKTKTSLEIERRYRSIIVFLNGIGIVSSNFINLNNDKLSFIIKILTEENGISNNILDFYYENEGTKINDKLITRIRNEFPNLSDKEMYIKYIKEKLIIFLKNVINGNIEERQINHFVAKYQFIFDELLTKTNSDYKSINS